MQSAPQTKPNYLAITALSGAVLVASLGVSITSVALPALSRVFPAPVSVIQWVALSYLLSATVAIVLAGRCADLFGHRFMLMTGLLIFAAASVLCATASTLGMLIAARAVQGIGGAILMALPVAIIRGMVTKERTGSAMGLLATMSAIGTALGPSLGGILIAFFGWRSAFILLTIASAAVLALAIKAVPPMPATDQTNRSLDLPGAILLGIVLTCYAIATTGIKTDINWGLIITLPVILFALGLLIVVEIRSPSPLVPVSLLRSPVISTSLATNLLISTVMMSMLVVGPFFLSFGLQLGEAGTGLVVAVGPVVAAIAGIPAGRITDRFGTSRVLTSGLAVMIIALICMALLPVHFGTAGYIMSLIILTPCFQLFLAANNTVMMIAAPEEERGTLSGLLGLSRNLGFMTGASVMATVFITALEPEQLNQASAGTIAYAFTVTFLIAAGLALLSLIITMLSIKKIK